MKTLLVNLKDLGIDFHDIKKGSDAPIAAEDVKTLNRKMYDILSWNFHDKQDILYLKHFMPAGSEDKDPDPDLWRPDDWLFGGVDADEVQALVHGWNHQALQELDKAVEDYRADPSGRGRVRNAKYLAFATAHIERPDCWCDRFVVRGTGQGFFGALVSPDVEQSVGSEPHQWAVLRIA